MNGIIVYQGKYGATRQYAEWAGEELQLPVFSPGDLTKERLAEAGFILLGSSVYVGKMLIRGWLKKNLAILKSKRLYLFVVCGTSSSDKIKQAQIIRDNIPGPLLENCRIYFLPGRLTRDRLSRKDGWMLRIGAWLEKDPSTKQAMLHDMDAVRKDNMEELLHAVCEAFLLEKG